MLSSFKITSSVIKPNALKSGALVGVISPSSSISELQYKKLLENFVVLGLKLVQSTHLRAHNGFLAGTDEQRIEDLHAMYQNPKISAIICARGGYGATRLLDQIDYSIIAAHPKPLIGYSDITALLLAFYKNCGHVGFNGPVGVSTFNEYTLSNFNAVLTNGEKIKLAPNTPNIIVPGKSSGRLIGGNLSLLVSMIGTRHDPSWKDHILFIEEVSESTYRIDRMLTQLRSSGKLRGVKGIALGNFTKGDTLPGDPNFKYSIALNEVFHDRLGDLGIPVLAGFSFGHEEDNATLPIGILASLDTETSQLALLESAVKH